MDPSSQPYSLNIYYDLNWPFYMNENQCIAYYWLYATLVSGVVDGATVVVLLNFFKD